MMIAAFLAVVALILEVVHFALTRDLSLPFLALAVLTLAALALAWGAGFPVLWHRGGPSV